MTELATNTPGRYRPLVQDATAIAVKGDAGVWLGGGDTYSEVSTSMWWPITMHGIHWLIRSESENSFPYHDQTSYVRIDR